MDRFSKNTEIQNFMKILPVGAELLLRTDGQTDMTTLIVAFRNFAKAVSIPTPKTLRQFLAHHFNSRGQSTVHSAKSFPIKFIRIKLLPFPTGAGDSSILQKVELCSVDQPFSHLTLWRRNYFFNFSTSCI
jgi:hypothetical protein